MTTKNYPVIQRHSVLRGSWAAESFDDGRVGVVIEPEVGEPAGMIVDAVECANLASQLWKLAQLAKSAATTKPKRKKRETSL